MRLKKTNLLKSGDVMFAYFSNNRGKSGVNCRLVVAPAGTDRTAFSRDVKNVVSSAYCGHWAGDVNLSKYVCEQLGIEKQDVCS